MVSWFVSVIVSVVRVLDEPNNNHATPSHFCLSPG
jgi:hypothetical protein